MSKYIMIARHGKSKDEVNQFTLINETYQTVTVKKDALINSIKAGKDTFINLAVENGKVVSTNGATDKYTLIDEATNAVVGTARAVILDRAETNGKLVGYTVFMQNGQIRELSVADAAALASKGLIANGKIRHTAEGDVVSAIGGNYPLRVITIAQAPKGENKVKIAFFAATVKDNKAVKYAGAFVSSTSAVTMSKMIDELTNSNAKVKAAVAKLKGDKDASALSIQRMGANSLYGVFELATIEKIAKASKSVERFSNDIVVSVIDASENVEAVAKIGKDNAVNISDAGNAKTSSAIKKYSESVVALISTLPM